MAPKVGRKAIHIHIGPHETGTAQISHILASHKSDLVQKCGITPVKGRYIRDLAKGLRQGKDALVTAALTEMVASAEQHATDIVLSAPELAGQMPGRPGNRQIYPDLARNLTRIRDGLASFEVRFYFFNRDRDRWLRSIYVQLLRKQTRFKSFDGFLSFLTSIDGMWDDVLAPARETLPSELVEIPFLEDYDFSPANALMSTITRETATALPAYDRRFDSLLGPQTVKILEEINASGASTHAVEKAKDALFSGPSDSRPPGCQDYPDWPPQAEKPDWLAPELEPLWSRTEGRTKTQRQPNLMPELDCDLAAYRTRVVEAEDEFPEGGRHHMENQTRILAYRFRGKPEICYLLGLTISYLRRGTDHTDHAARLFQRLWAEEHAVLLGVLPARWLISSFQTFMDHGCNEAQRRIGAAAYFMTNTLKLYETERALDGLAPDGTYPSVKPTTKSGFPGLDRFHVGGTDLMLNTNALLLELAAQDAVAGRVLQEFILRMKCYNTAFSRMDQSRLALKVENKQFSNCWSFFEPPKS